MQLCTPKEFRQKVGGGNSDDPSLICKNNKPHGIPQGVPISDLLANAYLLDFDIKVAEYIRDKGGKYWRYSDDIAIVLPSCNGAGEEIVDFVSELITDYGKELQIKNQKTMIEEFNQSSGSKSVNGIEYLGFRFDGKKVYLRNSTLSNFYRKIKRSARKQARIHVARYKDKDVQWLLKNFDYHQFENKFGRVKNYIKHTGQDNWTFWTYIRRASDCFGDRSRPILNQVKNYRKFIRCSVETEIMRLKRY